MAYQPINLGSAPDDGTGDPPRTAGTKINSNFSELYSAVVNINAETAVIDGVGDQIQLRVQGHSTQTADIFVVETSAGTDLFSVNNSGNVTVAGTVDGRDLATDGAKLDGIEAGATADQTGSEIKTLYEAEADTNAYTDAEKSKLAGIEAGADVTDQANVTAALAGGTVAGAVTIDGSADEIQLRVQGNSAQTSDIFVVENSAGTDLLTVNNSGRLDVAWRIVLGDTTGSVGLTTNDNFGHANITFNHVGGVPDVSGSSARINCPVDSVTSSMNFQLADNVTSGVVPSMSTPFSITTSYAQFSERLIIDGSSDDTQLKVQGNAVQTSDIFVVENSAGTDLLTVDNSGNTAITGDLVVSGGDVIVGGMGLIYYDASVNLLSFTEEFDNASWLKYKLTVSPNVIAAPDGSLTADQLVEDTTTGEHYIEQPKTVGNGETYTCSVFAKATTSNKDFWIRFAIASLSTTRFDVDLGVIVGSTAADAGIESVGDGWYRCWATCNPTTAGTLVNRIQLIESSSYYTGDGVSGIYLWGAQLEVGSALTQYRRNRAVDSLVIENSIGEDALLIDVDGNITVTGGANFGGNVTVAGTVDGRDLATDGAKLDGIEAGADVTDAANVTTALLGIRAVELGAGFTGDRACYIDFHADDTNTDTSLRILRNGGVNGAAVLSNLGTGGFLFTINGTNYPLGLYTTFSTFQKRLNVIGYADDIQLLVRGNSVQTSDIFVVENSAGTDLLTVDNSGNLSVAGEIDHGLVWKDLLGFPIARTLGATDPAFTAFRGGACDAYAFGAGEEVMFYFHIPHDYASAANSGTGSNTHLYLHIHWAHNGTAISGTMQWDYAITYAKGHNQAAFPAETTGSISYSTVNIATTPQYQHRIDEVQITASTPGAGQIDSDDIEVDGLLMVNISANTIPTITGGSPNEPFLFMVDLHYQAATVGTANKAPNFYT